MKPPIDQPPGVLGQSELLLGFCLKQVPEAPDGFFDSRIERIASVSECIANRPEGWQQRWDFNATGRYDTADAADAAGAGVAAVAAAGVDGGGYGLVAHTFVPVCFDRSGRELEVEATEIFGEDFRPLPRDVLVPGFAFLGFDVVQRVAELEPRIGGPRVLGGGFGCSPLSCNGCSAAYAINRWCLLDSLAEAAVAARDLARSGSGAEDGRLYIFGVYQRIARGGIVDEAGSGGKK